MVFFLSRAFTMKKLSLRNNGIPPLLISISYVKDFSNPIVMQARATIWSATSYWVALSLFQAFFTVFKKLKAEKTQG